LEEMEMLVRCEAPHARGSRDNGPGGLRAGQEEDQEGYEGQKGQDGQQGQQSEEGGSVVAAARGPAARAGEGDPDDGGDEQVGALEEQPWSA